MNKSVKLLAVLGSIGLVAWEIRGAVMAAPVFYALWTSGGDAMKIWLGICALGGIALSVAVPWFVAKRISRRASPQPTSR